ncbi:hypothetical protein P7K49_005349, partial [Saguinus oedipus]
VKNPEAFVVKNPQILSNKRLTADLLQKHLPQTDRQTATVLHPKGKTTTLKKALGKDEHSTTRLSRMDQPSSHQDGAVPGGLVTNSHQDTDL